MQKGKNVHIFEKFTIFIYSWLRILTLLLAHKLSNILLFQLTVNEIDCT